MPPVGGISINALGALMTADLVTEQGLQDACRLALETSRLQNDHSAWLTNLSMHLHDVHDASESLFLSPAFQQDLWESETISATGMGTVDVTAVIQSEKWPSACGS